ncbi:VWFA and cache domain-containing protein 1 [Saguinus oedipus]|uniref:VWFA and cache domain-containing protein 1 n=1 Tax=Saguinus oedipus TaxID=9490 RepID=A0ABQ9VDP9_SAGOE|nr:VWFA and cache domain-containing protein 1 [Saguinus oedipus]
MEAFDMDLGSRHNQERFDGNFNTNVSRTISCDRLSTTVNSRAFNPGRDLNSVLADNLKSNPGIKWQYFSSEEGIFTVFPAHKFRCKGSYEHRSRPIYVSTVRPQSKHIVVILDHGASVTDTQLQIAKDAAQVILSAIDEHDKISVLTVADTVRTCSLDQCYKTFLSPATSETKRKMSTFVSSVKSSDSPTQHAVGFQKAFQLIRSTNNNTKFQASECILSEDLKVNKAELKYSRQIGLFVNATHLNTPKTYTDMVIIYLSAGITSKDSSEEDKKATLRVINEENSFLNNSVMILTYALMNDGVTGLKELAFLRDLAEQNSGKYGVPDRTTLPVIKGSMMVLNQLSNLETTVGRFYTNLPNRMIDEAVFSLPFSDEMGDEKKIEETLFSTCPEKNRNLKRAGIPGTEYFCCTLLIYENGFNPRLKLRGLWWADGLIMTVSKPCYFGNLLLGIVGVDVNLAYILEDVTYYQDSLASYTFLIDDKGYTLMHPSLTRPYLLSEAPLHTDIIHYENIPKFELVRQNILSLPLGSQIIAVPVNSSLSWHINKLRETGKEAYNVSYAWKMRSIAMLLKDPNYYT